MEFKKYIKKTLINTPSKINPEEYEQNSETLKHLLSFFSDNEKVEIFNEISFKNPNLFSYLEKQYPIKKDISQQQNLLLKLISQSNYEKINSLIENKTLNEENFKPFFSNHDLFLSLYYLFQDTSFKNLQSQKKLLNFLININKSNIDHKPLISNILSQHNFVNIINFFDKIFNNFSEDDIKLILNKFNENKTTITQIYSKSFEKQHLKLLSNKDYQQNFLQQLNLSFSQISRIFLNKNLVEINVFPFLEKTKQKYFQEVNDFKSYFKKLQIISKQQEKHFDEQSILLFDEFSQQSIINSLLSLIRKKDLTNTEEDILKEHLKNIDFFNNNLKEEDINKIFSSIERELWKYKNVTQQTILYNLLNNSNSQNIQEFLHTSLFQNYFSLIVDSNTLVKMKDKLFDVVSTEINKTQSITNNFYQINNTLSCVIQQYPINFSELLNKIEPNALQQIQDIYLNKHDPQENESKILSEIIKSQLDKKLLPSEHKKLKI